MSATRGILLSLHEWDELLSSGGFYCLHCTEEDSWGKVVTWPCQPLLAAGITPDDARNIIAVDRNKIAAEQESQLDRAKRRGQQQADAWNAAHPIGTRVIAYPSVRPEYNAAIAADTRLITTTRTPAWILGHGEPVVSVEGYAGGICLTHVDVVTGEAS